MSARLHVILALAIATAATAALAWIPGISAVWIGEHISSGLVILVVALPALAFALGIQAPRQKVRFAWVAAIAWAAYMLVPVPVVLHGKKETLASERAALKALAQAGRRNLVQFEALRKGAPPPAPGEAPGAIASDDRSALGLAAPLAQAYLDDSLAMARAQAAAHEATGLARTLEPGMLATPEGIGKNRRRFAEYLALLGADRKQNDAAYVAYRDKLVEVMDESPKAREFLRGVDESNRKRTEIATAWNTNRTDTVAELSAINEFIAARQGSFNVYQDKLRFGGQRDLERYQQMMANVERLAAEEDALARQDVERLRRALARIEALAER